MDQTQAQRFLMTAQDDYVQAVRGYVATGGDGPWRAEALAARQVLELAQQEVERAQEREGLLWSCARCGARVASLQWPAGTVTGTPGLCATCFAQEDR